MMSILSGIHCGGIGEAESLSLVFDKMPSVNRRKLVNGRIGRLVMDQAAGCEFEQANFNAAVSIVGADSIFGSLTESFIYEIRQNSGKSLSDIDWAKKLPATGVPYVDRIAVENVSIEKIDISAGQRIRLFLNGFQFDDADELDGYFGAGRHTCLGKAVSVKAWDIMTSILKKTCKRVEISKVKYRKSDFLFNAPSLVEIRVRNV